MPFLCWAKDEEGKYIWGNRKIREFAQEDIIGKTDYELIWSNNADALVAADNQVLLTGEPYYLNEHVDKSAQNQATLSVCKFLGELDGQRVTFGISFVID